MFNVAAAEEEKGLEKTCTLIPEGVWFLEEVLRRNRRSSVAHVVRFDLCWQNMRHEPELDSAH